MTSPRSFREAFTEDPADVKDRARIVGERDSARRIAVALESENARLAAVIDKVRGHSRAVHYIVDAASLSVAALTGGGDE